MNILVAGGFGLLGGRIAHKLHMAGHTIYLGTRHDRPVPKWLLDAEIRKFSWDSFESCLLACKNMDVVVHAAGMNAKNCTLNPPEALMANGYGTANLVQAAITANVKRFIYFSTAHVYDNPLSGEITEKTCPTNNHPYASSHLAGEKALDYALAIGKISGTVIRLSNGVGQPMSSEVDCWDLLASDLCRQAISSRRLVLKSSGRQMRDFVPLATVCRRVIDFVSNDVNDLPRIVNVCSSKAMSVFDMAKLIQQKCNSIFGYLPPIEVGEDSEVGRYLKIKSLHYPQIGEGNDDLSNEIESLLIYCKENF